MIFSFEQMSVFKNDHTINRKALIKTLKYKESLSSKDGWSVLFWLNHDYPRLISKIRGEKDKKNTQICLATLMYMLKGTPMVYNGEEIGMENYLFKSPDDFKDVNAKMIFDNAEDVDAEFNKLRESTRDHARTVMQWDSTKNAGFSAGKPWTYVNSNYKRVNVEKEQKTKDSILNNYSRLLAVRKEYGDALCCAKYKFFNKCGFMGYKITCDGYILEVVANLSKTERKLNLKGAEVLYSNMAMTNSLQVYQTVILKRSL